MGELEIRLLLRLLRKERVPQAMLDRLLEMYREQCRKSGITPSSERGTDPRPPWIVLFPGRQRP